MQTLEFDWHHVIKIWWLILWRTVVGGALIGFALGLVVGFTWTFTTHTLLPQWASLATGGVVYLVWGPIVVRMALRKHYQGFRIGLLATP
jgi:hypothetical protein